MKSPPASAEAGGRCWRMVNRGSRETAGFPVAGPLHHGVTLRPLALWPVHCVNPSSPVSLFRVFLCREEH